MAIRDRWSWAWVIASSVCATIVAVALHEAGAPVHQFKLLLAAIVALCALTAPIRPRIALAVALAVAPFDFDVKSTFIVPDTNSLILIVLGVVLLPTVRPSLVPRWFRFGTILLTLGSSLTIFVAFDRGQATFGAARWAAVSVLGWSAFSVLRDDPNAVRTVMRIFSATAALVAVFAFAQKSGHYVIVGAPYSAGRINSTFGYYTNFGEYMAIGATLSLGGLIDAREHHQRRSGIFFAATMMLSVLGLLVSLSRGGLLAFGVGLLFLTALQIRRFRNIMTILGVVVAALVVSWFAAPHSEFATFANRLTQAQNDDVSRFVLAAAGTSALESHALGLGYGNFTHYVDLNVFAPAIDFQAFHAQRTVVQIGLDAGWIGLVGYLMLLGVPLAAVLRRTTTGHHLSIVSAAFAAAVAGYAAEGLFDYLYAETSFLVFTLALVWGTVAPTGAITPNS